MKLTDRIPPYRPAKPMWSTRPRRVEQLAIEAGRKAKNFDKGVRAFYTRTATLRREFTRFTTTPNWEGVKGCHAGAASMFKQ